MFNTRNIFHKLSYLQYPLMLVAIYFALIPYFNGFLGTLESFNNMLIFMGLGLSFSTLQDTTKTQNKASKKIWENPKKGKIAIILIVIFAFSILMMGLLGLYFSKSEVLQQMSYGMIVFGVGVVGLLKTAIEMFENHRLDKNPPKNVDLMPNKLEG